MRLQQSESKLNQVAISPSYSPFSMKFLLCVSLLSCSQQTVTKKKEFHTKQTVTLEGTQSIYPTQTAKA